MKNSLVVLTAAAGLAYGQGPQRYVLRKTDMGVTTDKKNSYKLSESAVDTQYSRVPLTESVRAVETHYMAEVPVAHEVEIQSLSQLPVVETVSKQIAKHTYFKPALRLVSTTTLE